MFIQTNSSIILLFISIYILFSKKLIFAYISAHKIMSFVILLDYF